MSILKRRLANAPPTPAAPPTAEGRFSKVRIAKMAATRPAAERPDRFEALRTSPVRDSPDLQRILALPRRPPVEEDSEESKALIERMTARLSNGRPAGQGCKCHELNPAAFTGVPGSACITRFRHIQAWYLAEAEQVGGILGPIAVGAGKTGIDVEVAMVVPDCKEAVLLLPPTLKPQFLADFRLWAQHFKVPNVSGGPGAGPNGEFVPGRPVLHVLKYSELSSPRFSSWFAARPKISVVIADEAQALKDRSAVRVGRFLDHFISAAERDATVRFFSHTGSMTSKGIEDYAHLSSLALGAGSPVPLDPHIVTAWGEALNPPRHGLRAPPGALLRLCATGEDVNSGFSRRLLETPGVVSTTEGSLRGVELRFAVRRPPPIPLEVRAALAQVRGDQIRPDGEELEDALEVARCVREVACGFYMHWSFPGAKVEDFKPGGRIDVWFARRKAWNREVRKRLMTYTPDMDSPFLLKEAARRSLEGYTGEKPVWHSEHFAAWREVEDTVPHVTRTKWLSDWLARDAAAWALEAEQNGRPGIVWTANPELGHLIAKLAGRPYYGAGDAAAIAIRAERGDRSVVASIPAHHKGRNLQAFSANLIVQPPSDAGVFEQLLGRTHRSGQRRSEVLVFLYQHVPEMAEAFEVAMGRARYVKGTLRNAQKLLAAEGQVTAGREGAGGELTSGATLVHDSK